MNHWLLKSLCIASLCAIVACSEEPEPSRFGDKDKSGPPQFMPLQVDPNIAVTGEAVIQLSHANGFETFKYSYNRAEIPWAIEHQGKIASMDAVVWSKGRMAYDRPDVALADPLNDDLLVTAEFPKQDLDALILLAAGQRVKVIGQIEGDGKLIRCKLTDIGPNPTLWITMDELAHDLENNHSQLSSLIHWKPIALEGEIATIARDPKIPGHEVHNVSLKPAGDGPGKELKVEFVIPAFEKESAAGLKAGMTIWIKADWPAITGPDSIPAAAPGLTFGKASQFPSVHRAPPAAGLFRKYADVKRAERDSKDAKTPEEK